MARKKPDPTPGIALLAPWPAGDGPRPGRPHLRMRRSIYRIARRVAVAAIVAGSDDVLGEVYAAGAAHAVEMLRRTGQLAPLTDSTD